MHEESTSSGAAWHGVESRRGNSSCLSINVASGISTDLSAFVVGSYGKDTILQFRQLLYSFRATDCCLLACLLATSRKKTSQVERLSGSSFLILFSCDYLLSITFNGSISCNAGDYQLLIFTDDLFAMTSDGRDRRRV